MGPLPTSSSGAQINYSGNSANYSPNIASPIDSSESSDIKAAQLKAQKAEQEAATLQAEIKAKSIKDQTKARRNLTNLQNKI